MIAYALVGGLLVVGFLVLLGRYSRADSRTTRKNIFWSLLPVGGVLLLLLMARGQFLTALIIAAGSAWLLISSRSSRPAVVTERAEAARLLGVTEDASEAEIKAAHRRLIAKHHPDKGGDAEMAASLNAARKCLLGK